MTGIAVVSSSVALVVANVIGGVVADDLSGNLLDDLEHDRVDLSGHDRAARLEVGHRYLAQPAGRTRTEQAEIAGDLVHRQRRRPTRTVEVAERLLSTLGLEVIGCLTQRQVEATRQALGDLGAERRRGVESGADGRAAERQLEQSLGRRLRSGGAASSIDRAQPPAS